MRIWYLCCALALLPLIGCGAVGPADGETPSPAAAEQGKPDGGSSSGAPTSSSETEPMAPLPGELAELPDEPDPISAEPPETGNRLDFKNINPRFYESGGTDASEAAVQSELYALRRELLVFRRRVQPLREVISALLRREVDWVDTLARTHFQDVYDHVLRATDQLDAQRELLGNAVDAHLALISNRMNEVMKKMTSWGAILLGSTLIAGIYGMNFRHMPELDWEFGYPLALGVMAVVTFGLWRYFKRKGWL